MAEEINYADLERQVNSSKATDQQCYQKGQAHRAYGWFHSPCGDWDERQAWFYERGYRGLPMKEVSMYNH